MSLISYWFFLFFFLTLALYYLLPKRLQWVCLLVASYAFIVWCSGIFRLPLVLLDVAITYVGARCIARAKRLCVKRWILAFTVGLPIVLLAALKLTDRPLTELVNRVLEQFHADARLVYGETVLSPIGISYFTLSMLGYVLDVYWEKCTVQKNIFKHALYVGYFPSLTSGPVVNYGQMAPQLFAEHAFDYDKVTFGLQRMVWGYLKKLVIADRLMILTGTLFADRVMYQGLYIPLGVLCYAFQIYTDFSGCMDIVLGASEALQIQLPENFKRPFFSKTLSEFWRRWHITLGLWSKEYILYPLLKTELFIRMGKLGKKLFGKRVGKNIPTYIGLGIVWLIIGIWHGGSFRYVFAAGFLPWFFMVGGQLLQPVFSSMTRALHIRTECWSYRQFCRLRTLLLMCVIWLFATSRWALDGFYVIRQAFAVFNPWILVDGSLYELGLDRANVLLVAFSLMGVLFVDILQEKGYSIRSCIARQNFAFRWICYLGAVFFVIVFGMYGPGYNPADFIYAGF